ncbi:MAG: riboflavin synthase [Oscillospiraceae bacterium]|nr:riboflavin synthase [Oscillospiraceae bacterium]MBR1530420.1 riboflavin synthase [Oscillospiraceae bacterium]
MFTGIIEEIGNIRKIQTGADTCVLTVSASKILSDLHIGDSIAVNGTCLTVCKFDQTCFSADVMPETMRRTNLGSLKSGSPVNLERAMSANGRFGGHIVSGHIDGTGVIKSLKKEKNAVWVKISAKPEILKYIVEKGSVAIDGISLTVAKISNQDFSVSIIPHTGEETILLQKKAGEIVNLECDIIAKYVEKLCNFRNPSGGISENFLAEHGFL